MTHLTFAWRVFFDFRKNTLHQKPHFFMQILRMGCDGCDVNFQSFPDDGWTVWKFKKNGRIHCFLLFHHVSERSTFAVYPKKWREPYPHVMLFNIAMEHPIFIDESWWITCWAQWFSIANRSSWASHIVNGFSLRKGLRKTDERTAAQVKKLLAITSVVGLRQNPRWIMFHWY